MPHMPQDACNGVRRTHAQFIDTPMPPEYVSLEEHIKSLPWRFRLRLWFSRRKVRKWIRQGYVPTIYDCCDQCLHPIEPNDDARLCTHCGGRNMRVK